MPHGRRLLARLGYNKADVQTSDTEVRVRLGSASRGDAKKLHRKLRRTMQATDHIMRVEDTRAVACTSMPPAATTPVHRPAAAAPAAKKWDAREFLHFYDMYGAEDALIEAEFARADAELALTENQRAQVDKEVAALRQFLADDPIV